MFGSKPRGTVIAKALKIVGSITAEGLVEIDGQIDGELHCTSLVTARGAHVNGNCRRASRGRWKSRRSNSGRRGPSEIASHVVGDIHHQSLSIESGAFFNGRSVRVRGNGQPPEKLESKRQVANTQESLSRRIERAESVEAD